MAPYKLGRVEEVHRKVILVCGLEGQRKVAFLIYENMVKAAS